MKHHWLALSVLVIGMTVAGLPPVLAQQRPDFTFYRICTRDSGSRVNLRTGPGTNYGLGLEQVGSGGMAVVNAFSTRGYSLAQDDELGQQIERFRVVENSRGESWSLVGTNQWTAWVRSDFICPMRADN